MTQAELHLILQQLCKLTAENEIVEFKEAKNGYDFNKIGKYFSALSQKAAYSKNKGFDKVYYLDFIQKAIREHKSLKRSDIDDLLWNKLPEYMDEKQKKIKINNLLSELRKKKKIENIGTFKNPKWVLLMKIN